MEDQKKEGVIVGHKYADCSFCGGRVEEKRVRVDYRIGDKLIIFEDVPAGVCRQCGEHYYTAKVAKRLERLASDPETGHERVVVPVCRFSEEVVV